MMGRSNLIGTYIWFFLGGILVSCSSDRVFEEYQGMEPLHWDISDTVTFELYPQEPQQVVATIGIRYNENYEFHNLYVKYLMKDSLGQSLVDSLININLFDSKTGKPLGKGFGNVFTKYDTLPLSDVGSHGNVRVQFLQFMRRDRLEGIEAVGLKVVQK